MISVVFLLALPFAFAQEACVGWESVKRDFLNAQNLWSEPSCYDFAYTIRRLTATESDPISVQFRDGSSGGEKSLGDFLRMIQDECFASCPGAGAHKCTIVYATAGYPVDIFIDRNEFSAGEELSFEITGYQPCSEEPFAPSGGTSTGGADADAGESTGEEEGVTPAAADRGIDTSSGAVIGAALTLAAFF